MSLKIAVVSDALSPELIFKHWHRYYGGLFGEKNLFLLTYAGLSDQFKNISLGGVIELPVGYDDNTRCKFISSFVTAMLASYDAVIRVDVDEFLVVDPREGKNLAEYIETMSTPYLAARGFDIIQMPDEAQLDDNAPYPILAHRSCAYPNSALNKIAITKIPITWTPGFHWANVYPKFGPIFMLHMKRVDIGWQLNWFSKMTENIKNNPKVNELFRDYYRPDEQKIRNFHIDVSRRKRHGSDVLAWYREITTKQYLDKITILPNGIYSGEFGQEPNTVCELPEEWKTLI